MYTGLIDGEWATALGTLLHFVEAATGVTIDPGGCVKLTRHSRWLLLPFIS